MEKEINGTIYNTEQATLIAHDHYFDGHNWDRNGVNQYLYRTDSNEFFIHRISLWAGEPHDDIFPIDRDGAIGKYHTELSEHEVSVDEAFNLEKEDLLEKVYQDIGEHASRFFGPLSPREVGDVLQEIGAEMVGLHNYMEEMEAENIYENKR